MDLYGSLPEAKGAPDKKQPEKQLQKWSQASRLLPSAVKSSSEQQNSARPKPKPKKPAFLTPHSVRRGLSEKSPASTGSAALQQESKRKHEDASPARKFPPTAAASFSAVLKDEYDPSKPNDFVAFRSKKEEEARDVAKKQKIEMQAELAEFLRHLREKEREFSAPVVPDLHISGEEAYLRRANLHQRERVSPHPCPASTSSDGAAPGGSEGNLNSTKPMSMAEKMMAKMGWKEGEGLGRSKQGIKKPLEAQKVARSGGIIVESDSEEAKRLAEKDKGSLVSVRPTRILLLKNMVGPGEVDDELEDEVANECEAKYGHVLRVTIFEATDPSLPTTEVIRIFVEFETCSSSMRAHAALNGRFFGGRQVVAEFYDEQKFEKDELL